MSYNLAGRQNSLDARIKSYADAIYDQSQMKSVAESSSARVAFLNQRAARNPTQYIPLGGIDVQALVRLFGEHIERCMTSRLASYKTAFQDGGKTPNEEEFTEILNEFKRVREREVASSAAALSRLASSQGAVNIGNVRNLLETSSAQAHDRVLRDWKIWRERTRLQQPNKQPTSVEKKPEHDKGAMHWLGEKLWRWEVIAIGAPFIYAAGVTALYGDDYAVAAAFYLIGIAWPTARILASRETRTHKRKWRVRSLIAVSSLAILAASLAWISHRERLHRVELAGTPRSKSPEPAPAQSPTTEGQHLQVTQIPPKTANSKVVHELTVPNSDEKDAVSRTVTDVISGALHVPRSRVVPSARLTEDLGADYLDKQELEMGIEGAFDIRIPATDWIKIRTVKDVNEYVHGRLRNPTNATN
jgi:acyl carrier protein